MSRKGASPHYVDPWALSWDAGLQALAAMRFISLTWGLPGLTSTLASSLKQKQRCHYHWLVHTAHPTAAVLREILTARTSESDCAGGHAFKRITECKGTLGRTIIK